MTKSLFDLRDGVPVLRGPSEYHGDPVRGQIHCNSRFEYDLFRQLGKMGFEARMSISDYVPGCIHGTFNFSGFTTGTPASGV